MNWRRSIVPAELLQPQEVAVWVTPFSLSPLQTTAPSQPAGVSSLDEVVAVMGEHYVKRTRHLIIYHVGDEGVLFSRIPWA